MKTLSSLAGRLGLLVCLLLWGASALAQMTTERQFPPGTKRGVLDMSRYPDIRLDGKARYLSPGARIFNNENLLVLPSTLDAPKIIVNYTENTMGDIDKVWILTTAEMPKVLPKPEVWAPMPFKNPEIK